MIYISAFREHDTGKQRLTFRTVYEDENFNIATITVYPDDVESDSLIKILESVKKQAESEIERIKKNG